MTAITALLYLSATSRKGIALMKALWCKATRECLDYKRLQHHPQALPGVIQREP